jgi:hypothetical protein
MKAIAYILAMVTSLAVAVTVTFCYTSRGFR